MSLIQQVGGLLGAGDVERDDVAPAQQRIQIHHGHIHAGGRGGGEEGIKGRHLHAQAPGLAGHGGADAAQADDAQLLAFQFEAGKPALGPFACPHARCGRRRVPGQGKEQGEGLFGGSQRVAIGRVHDGDAALGGGLHINGVHARARAADEFQFVRTLQGLRIHLGGAADEQHLHAFEGNGKGGGIFDGVGNLDGPSGGTEGRQALLVNAIASKNAHGNSKDGYRSFRE